MADDSLKPEKPSLPDDEDIQKRFERIRDDLKNIDLPELPDDEALRAKIQHVTTGSSSYQMPEVPEIPINRPKQKSIDGTPGSYNYKSLGLGMSAAYSLIGSMIVGFGLGWLFDRLTHSNYGQVVGALAGSVLGIVTAIWMINRDNGGAK